MDWCKKALEFGFDHAGMVRAQDLECLPEVRDMCAADRCRAFGTRWTCPPGCGTLAECAARLKEYGEGVLVQTTGILDDPFDADAMLETERVHKVRFAALAEAARAEADGCLPLGAGTCELCPRCTYPDAPCRFPGRAVIPWRPMGCWCPVSASGPAYPITTDPTPLPIPAASSFPGGMGQIRPLAKSAEPAFRRSGSGSAPDAGSDGRRGSGETPGRTRDTRPGGVPAFRRRAPENWEVRCG